ncbi:MAG: hypothetical protein CVV21_11690 [Candidatus Goldiibacteriota bacterium HGW-Goldbacteria-1]|jgi:hypothetical protein|nr:MAG: hypothetical protein CVV21_11690 [Candidatus Goldiibacteriota bacterium HGW-Goldbacteria-1]
MHKINKPKGGTMKKDEREARKHPRFTKILNISAVLDRFPDDLTGEKSKLKQGESFRATTINVSEEGMLINCDFLLPERTTLKLEIHENAIAEDKFNLLVRIEWTKRNAYKIFGRYSAGLHILEGEKKHIEKLIEHFNEN